MLCWRCILLPAATAGAGGRGLLHTSTLVLARRGRRPASKYGTDMQMFDHMDPKDIENSDYDQLINHVFPSTEDLREHAKDEIRNDENKKRIVDFKREEKNFRDVYRIQPGEEYQRKKDPYFKKNKNSPDYNHPHHYMRKERAKFDATKRQEDYLTATNDQGRHSKSNSTLNLVQLARQMYISPETGTKFSSSKYRAEKAPLLSPEDAYQGGRQASSAVTGKSMFTSQDETAFPPPPRGVQRSANGQHISTSPSNDGEGGPTSFAHYQGPNLLLYSMKEQIRHLSDTDPDFWTPEMLSTVFPIAPDKAKLVARNRWSPSSEEALAIHDRTVLDNWQRMGNKVFKEAFVREVVEKRYRDALLGGGVSDLPVPSAVSDKMLDLLANLHYDGIDDDVIDREKYDHLERMKKKKQSEPARAPRGGYFIDIVNNYKQQLKSLEKERSPHGADDQKEAGGSQQLTPSQLEVIIPGVPDQEELRLSVRVPHVAADDDESHVVFRHHHKSDLKQDDPTKELMTYAEFVRQREDARKTR